MTIRQPALSPPTTRRDLRVVLLAAQSVCLGLTLAFIIITSFSLVLTYFGANAVPWAYIAVALLGSTLFYGMAELQRHWPLMRVAMVVDVIVVLFLAAAWVGLAYTNLHWISFATLVAFSLIVQVGFVILGGQTGRLFNVREIRRAFPRIVSGFGVGFMLGGLLAPSIQRWLGSTEDILLAATMSAALMLGFLHMTVVRYRDQLVTNHGRAQSRPAPPLHRLLLKRFVVILFLYQMLSAMGTQLIEYLLFVSAETQFVGELALSDFFSSFTVLLNLCSILFVLFGASLLLSRFGVRAGLMANPTVVLAALVVAMIAGLAKGPTSYIFFVLIAATRVLDIASTNGTTRAGINAVFQALPQEERVAVQTGVEGIGVPIALGLTGVLLLIFNAMADIPLLQITLFTLSVTVLWTLAGALTFRSYGAQLLVSMRRRILEPTDLTFVDTASRTAIDTMLVSDQINDVRFALDLLQAADNAPTDEQIRTLLASETPDIQVEILGYVEDVRVESVEPTVHEVLTRTATPTVRGAALRTVAALGEAESVEAISGYLTADERDVVEGAMVGLLRYGGISGVLRAGELLEQMSRAGDQVDRAAAARVIGQVADHGYYSPLVYLLDDPVLAVRREALWAAGQVGHPRLLAPVMDNVQISATRSLAIDALIAIGDAALPTIDTTLAKSANGKPVDASVVCRLVRVAGQIDTPAAAATLRGHLTHPNPEVRLAVLAEIARRPMRAANIDNECLAHLLSMEVTRTAEILAAQRDLGEAEALASLQRSLADELTLCGQRLLLTLGCLYDADAIQRTGALLASQSQSTRALALETVEVTLSSEHRRVAIPILEPGLAAKERLERLGMAAANPPSDAETYLRAILGPPDVTQPLAWTRCCAVYAIGELGIHNLAGIVEPLASSSDTVLAETAAWASHRL